MKIKPFKLERYYTQYEFAAKYSLCNSDCEAMTIKDLLSMEEGAMEKFHNQWLGYTETKGNPELRQAIAGIYDHISAEDLWVCTGAQEPIYLFSQAVVEDGDEVIVQSPCYQSLASVPESLGAKVLHWNVKYEGAKPTFDLDELANLITDKTKVIYLNAPHNPTGFHFTKAEQQGVVELARKHGIIIFCDEVYREIEHEPQYAIPAFADAYENGVSVGVMSKAYGLPGLRIGWVASRNCHVLQNIAILKEYTTICNAGPSEFLATVALKNRKTILKRNLSIIEKNLPLYDEFFKKYEDLFGWHRPNAGPIGMVQMKFSKDDAGFAKRALEEQKVLLLPGDVYDFPGFFRVGFGRVKMPESLVEFEKFVVKNFVTQ